MGEMELEVPSDEFATDERAVDAWTFDWILEEKCHVILKCQGISECRQSVASSSVSATHFFSELLRIILFSIRVLDFRADRFLF